MSEVKSIVETINNVKWFTDDDGKHLVITFEGGDIHVRLASGEITLNDVHALAAIFDVFTKEPLPRFIS